MPRDGQRIGKHQQIVDLAGGELMLGFQIDVHFRQCLQIVDILDEGQTVPVTRVHILHRVTPQAFIKPLEQQLFCSAFDGGFLLFRDLLSMRTAGRIA